MDSLIKDVRYAVRGLVKRPAFAAIAIVTLALTYSVVLPSHSSSWWRRSASAFVD